MYPSGGKKMATIQLSELGIMNSNAKYDEKINTTLGREVSWLMIHMERSRTKEYSQVLTLGFCKKNREKIRL